MKKSDKISYHQKDIASLTKLISDLNQKLVESKAKQQLGGLKDTSVFKKIKYEIALVQSLISSKHDSK